MTLFDYNLWRQYEPSVASDMVCKYEEVAVFNMPLSVPVSVAFYCTTCHVGLGDNFHCVVFFMLCTTLVPLGLYFGSHRGATATRLHSSDFISVLIVVQELVLSLLTKNRVVLTF